ncbi:hypothetical protein MTR67_001965 [Solanum verrucosum]|uniref:Retrotransposon gag domain-containing protein n=1 Tax=Solanum verrucosum TaxID=315347 RepID=A0AAF0PST6_SOLVR|nr:hypothetical protein MTR67_001965 [Solanum verrucosum]
MWKDDRGVDAGLTNWEKLVAAFLNRFFPLELREAKVQEFINLKQQNMSVKEYSLKFTQLSKYFASMVADSRARINKFISSVEETKVKEYRTAMLIKEMIISRLMTHAQLIEEEKAKECPTPSSANAPEPKFRQENKNRAPGSKSKGSVTSGHTFLKHLNLCQRRWLELLKYYNMGILYHSGRANVVVDALSWLFMNSVAHVEDEKVLVHDVHRLACLGYYLVDSSNGGVIIQNGFKSRVNGFTWHMTGVYAPTCNLERQEVWWEIGAVRSLFTGPWVLEGDFNFVRYASEKRNCSRTSAYMNDFSDVIEDMELIDPPLEGGNYTWARGSNLEAVSRIDRIMYSSEWGESFCNVKQELLPRVCSHHAPIALKSGRWSHTKSYFKFEGWWLETKGFNERIKDWWTSFEFEGRPDFILASKLKAMKTKLKDWSVSTYGNLEKRKKEMLNRVHEFDKIQQSSPVQAFN